MQVPALNDKDLKDLLLDKPIVAKLATVSRNGYPRVTPIWFGVRDGTFLMNTWENTAAARNIKRDPRCSLMIDQGEKHPYYGVHYWGTATVEGPENDEAGIARLFAPYVGSEEGARQYARQLIGWGKRVYLRFRPERSMSWDFR